MKKKTSILRRLIPWVVVLGLLAALVIFVGIPLYSQREEQFSEAPIILYNETKPGKVAIENEFLKLELDTATTYFTVTDKASGQSWDAVPKDAAKDKKANGRLLTQLQSTLLITYTDKDKGTKDISFDNFANSIRNGNYVINDVTEDTIEIIYAIGDISKIYQMPYAITEERYQMFRNQMIANGVKDSKVRSMVDALYEVHAPDKLTGKSEEDQAAELAMYPSVAYQQIRVLKTDTKTEYSSVEKYFIDAGYTEEDYDFDQLLINSPAESTKPVFNLTVRYRLEGSSFVVEIPFSEIRYRASYPITTVTVLPMFGAAGEKDEGFMLVPEGGGALMKLNNGKYGQNTYYSDMYGWDYATYRDEVRNETRSAFPVFGMAKGNNSFICIMENGSAYGGVQAEVSQMSNSYNWVCARYKLVHGDQYNVSNKTGTLVYMFEKELAEDESIVQRYQFLPSGSYVDMAHAYGDYLQARYPELAKAQAEADMPVSVELVGAIDKRVVKLGLPVNDVISTTSFSQAKEIIGKLTEEQIRNLNVRVTGWSNSGVQQKVLTSVHTVGQMGGDNGMRDLIAYGKEKNVPVYFDGITCFAYRSGIFQGFLTQRDAARYTTRERVGLKPFSSITFKTEDGKDTFYLVKASFAKRMADNLINALKDREAYGVAFRDIGSLLSADYNVEERVTREQVKQMNIETVQQAKEAGQAVNIKEGFDYVLPYVDLITDMNLSGTRYSILDQAVPFYQIAVHGMVNYTGQPINLANDWQTELLTCAEYGAGLNFTFMAEDAKILQDTEYSGYYGAYFADWEGEAVQVIRDYQTAMAGLNQQPIVDHQVINSDLTVTTYQNGAKVYVNFGLAEAQQDGVTIPARSYVVKGGEAQ